MTSVYHQYDLVDIRPLNFSNYSELSTITLVLSNTCVILFKGDRAKLSCK